MVVVSGNWANNVSSTHTLEVVNDNIVSTGHNMAARAILTCRPNSHPFQERTLLLDQPVKVGRSVARVKPTCTNAIFDCKVLSRHHALLWYEDGKFYLQDTKSSNGTFVNNNRLSAETENHELSSGDIVQFGVDVIENNRKVTHGCIIASIKLYLPDGKETKASPSINDGSRHGMIPLDDLYRLNQIIQEANQREQCLETKLAALQNAVDETRRSAEESWQVYVGEERLLSRVSALEMQLQHATKNWGEDKFKEEFIKLQEENQSYQYAAKEALEKLHSEKLEAVALAVERERARETAEQEALLAKEQFTQIQLELELIAKRLTEQQNEAAEQRAKLEQNEQVLESKLEAESDKCLSLQSKLQELNAFTIQEFDCDNNLDQENTKLIYDDLKCKEDILNENEVCDSLNNSNGNHICLTVRPVEETELSNDHEQEKIKDESKRVTFTLSRSSDSEETFESRDESEGRKNDREDCERDDYSSDHVDSKTLKYQFQTAQNEMKRRIELLESVANANKLIITELRKNLDQEREISQQHQDENEKLKEDFILLQQKWKESCNENQQHKDKIAYLGNELERAHQKMNEPAVLKDIPQTESTKISECWVSSTLNHSSAYDQLVNLEEELVLIKERFAQISEEKLKLQRDLVSLTEQYNLVCSRSYNKYFFYVAPLVFMVLYLLISAMIS